MAVEGDIQALLAPLVSGRCYPLTAPVGTVRPYIIFQVISNPVLNTLEGDAGISERRIQVDVWADSYGAAKGLLKDATAAITGAGHLRMNDNPDQYDSETEIYGASADFSVWGAS